MNEEKSYKKLIVYQKSNDLAFDIYRATNYFPGNELYGITSQMRRASTSVAANIVEGYMRDSGKERLRFYNVAKDSLIELEYFIDFSYKLGYLKRTQYEQICKQKDEVGRLLYGFIKSVKKYQSLNTRGTKLEARGLLQEAIHA